MGFLEVDFESFADARQNIPQRLPSELWRRLFRTPHTPGHVVHATPCTLLSSIEVVDVCCQLPSIYTSV